MIRFIKIVCGILFVATLTLSPSCHKDSNPVVVPPDSISDNSEGLVPFKIGNKWYYNYYYYDTSGTQLPGFHYDSAVVTRDTVISKERWYKIRNFKPADVDDWDWYTNRSDGIWVLRRVINPRQDTAYAYLTFKYPTVQGEYWGSPLGDSTRVHSTNEVVETPSGIDTCIKYEDHYEFSNLGDLHYYFAPNKGWVMLELFSRTDSGRLYVVNRLILVQVILR